MHDLSTLWVNDLLLECTVLNMCDLGGLILVVRHLDLLSQGTFLQMSPLETNGSGLPTIEHDRIETGVNTFVFVSLPVFASR